MAGNNMAGNNVVEDKIVENKIKENKIKENKIKENKIKENPADLGLQGPCLWQRLREAKKPLVLYGMGDGADKVLKRLADFGLAAAGVFASDEFVRGQSFAGFRVERYVEAAARLGDMTVLVCFGTEIPEVIERITAISGEQEVLVPHVPLFGEALVDEAFIERYRAELLAAADIWADEESCLVYRGYLQGLWSGEVGAMRAVESPRSDIWQILQPGENEVFCDFGAYDGDTVREFVKATGGKCRRIWAFEPDTRNFRKLEAALSGDERVRCLNCGVWSKSGQLMFAGKAGRNSCLRFDQANTKDSAVDVISLDEWYYGNGQTDGKVVNGESINGEIMNGEMPPTFMKFDVEGAEEAALLGGRRLIGEFRPKLQVAAYHRSEDIFRLPLLLKELNPEYRLYLRHHPYIPAWETNIYAV